MEIPEGLKQLKRVGLASEGQTGIKDNDFTFAAELLKEMAEDLEFAIETLNQISLISTSKNLPPCKSLEKFRSWK